MGEPTLSGRILWSVRERRRVSGTFCNKLSWQIRRDGISTYNVICCTRATKRDTALQSVVLPITPSIGDITHCTVVLDESNEFLTRCWIFSGYPELSLLSPTNPVSSAFAQNSERCFLWYYAITWLLWKMFSELWSIYHRWAVGTAGALADIFAQISLILYFWHCCLDVLSDIEYCGLKTIVAWVEILRIWIYFYFDP